LSGTTVSREGRSLKAESRCLAREFLDAHQKLVVVCWLTNACDDGWGNCLEDVVGTVGHGVQLDP
jgi:hypothetical protein